MAATSDHRLTQRAGIGHLILWTSCCAVYFALSRGFLPRLPTSPEGLLLLCILAAVTGACWAGSLVVAYRCVRWARPQIDPGEWLLFCLGLILAVDVITKLIPDEFIIKKPSLQLAATCGVLVLPTLSRRLPTRWKLLFLVFVSSYALPLCIVLVETLELWPAARLDNLLTVVSQVRPHILLASIAVVVILDSRERQFYGWGHWLGVGCTAIWVCWAWLG